MKDNGKIDFYCKKCGKSMKMAYSVSGDTEAPVLPGMTIKCHTNKCTRVMTLKNCTEGMVIAQADKDGKVFI